MKKILTLATFWAMGLGLAAQAPAKMSFQAVVRNPANALVSNSAVGLQVRVLQGSPTGTPVYEETHSLTSNANGLVTAEIGSGTVVSGNFSAIDWAAGPYFLETATDPFGGTAYTLVSTAEMLSVPYALYAERSGGSVTAGTGLGQQGDSIFAQVNSPIWNAGSIQGRPVSSNTPANNDVLQWNGTAWTPAAVSGGGGGGVSNWTVAGNNIHYTTGNVGIGVTLPADPLHLNGRIRLESSNGGFTAIQPNSVGGFTWVLPSSSGTPGDVLTTDGAGNLSWSAGSGGGGGTPGGTTVNCNTTSNNNYTIRGTGSGNWECTNAVWVTSTGRVGIGTTSPSTSYDLTIGTSGFLVNGTTNTSNIAGRLRIGSTSSTTYDLQVDGQTYVTSGLRVGSTTSPPTNGIWASGDIRTGGRFIQGSSTTGSGTVMVRTSSGELRPQSSTIRVKDNVQSLNIDPRAVLALRPVTYNLKPALGGEKEVGLIAEEVEKVIPDLVVYGPARQWNDNSGIPAKDENGNEIIDPSRQEPYSVHYDRLPVYLLEIIKQQQAQIEAMEERIRALERR
jgi:hypothetical protein